MNKVIVIGGDHHNTLGMVRSLGKGGLRADVFLIKDKGTQVKTVVSKFINNVMIFATDQEVVNYVLEQTSLDTSEKPVILFGSDSSVACFDANYYKLKDRCHFFNAKGELNTMMNKETMCKLAVEVGLNVPQHIVYHSGETIPQGIAFPCITKAISSIDGSKSNTTICYSEKELEKFLATPDLCHTIQIEKFIEKEIEYQSIGLSLNGGETIIIPGHSHIDRPKGIQNTYYFEYRINDDSFSDTLEKAKMFVKRTSYSGIFSVEFLRGKDGRDYFLEMNFRNDGNAICVTDAGFNLPYIWYSYSICGNYEEVIQNSTFRKVRYCPEVFYTLEYTYGEVSFFTWIINLFRANSFTNYYQGDSPFLYWPRFVVFAFKCMINKMMIKVGMRTASKESIG